MTEPEINPGLSDVRMVSPDTVERLPSWLLAASNRVVPFTGRQAEIADFSHWLGTPGGQPSFACRLVRGAPGQGKSRLAVELADVATGSGWQVTFARPRTDPGASASDINNRGSGSRGILVIVDDAGAWPMADLVKLVADLHGRNNTVLRFVLFSDRDGDWQTSLWWQLNHGSANADMMELEPLGRAEDGRISQFTAALNRFAEILGGEVRGKSLAGRLADDAFGSVQLLHMAALADVLAAKRGEPVVEDPYYLSSFLLQQEERGWQAAQPSSDSPKPPPSALARVAFVSNLIGPVSAEMATTALQHAGVASTAEDATLLVRRHATLYPPADAEDRLQPLETARLREDLIGLVSEESACGGQRCADWARQAVIRLLGITPGQSEPARFAARAITQLALSFRWPHVTQQLLYPLLNQWPQLAVEAGSGIAIPLVAALPDAPQMTLNRIAERTPADGGPDIALGAYALARRRLRRSGSDSEADEKAEKLYEVSFLAEAARVHDNALSMVTEAMALWQLPTDQTGQTSEENYASSGRRFKYVQAASRRSVLLEAIGQHEEAHSVLRDCMPAWERLIEYQEKQSPPAWSRTRRRGSRERLLLPHPVTIAEDAVEVVRKLAVADPDAFAARFGEWLVILLNRYIASKEYTNAAKIGPELEDLLRDAGSNDSLQFPRQVVVALFLLGQLWMATGEYAKAVDSYSRAAAILRSAQTDSGWDARESVLIRTLTEASFARLQLRDYAAGLAEVEEALPLCRQVDQDKPAKHADSLVRTLSVMALHYAMLDRTGEALATAEEAQRLARSLSGIGWFGLSLTFESYGWAMSKAGRHREAVAATAESLAVWRKGKERTDSTEAERGLPGLLVRYALTRVAAGSELQEALSAVNEAVEYCQTSGTAAGAIQLGVCLETVAVVRAALDEADTATYD
jgi:tetratricopeptide (TPR) repeat protein